MTIYAERGNDAYPLSELQAAVLLPQFDSLDRLNRQRTETVARLQRALAGKTPDRWARAFLDRLASTRSISRAS